MKKPTLLILLFCSLFTFAQEGNYVAVINGDSIPVEINTPFKYTTKKGEVLNITLTQPQILTYKDDYITFKHNKGENVSSAVLEEGIEQLMVMQSTGTGYMIQKYNNINPTVLLPFLMNEVTKESVSYGYEKKEEPFKIKLSSGQELTGTKATLTYKGNTEIYTVAAYGAKDEGVLVMTMLFSDEYSRGDQKMIDLLWETLEILK